MSSINDITSAIAIDLLGNAGLLLLPSSMPQN